MENNNYTTMSHYDLVETMLAIQAEIRRREDIQAAVNEINTQLDRLHDLTRQSEKLALKNFILNYDITDMLMNVEKPYLEVKFAQMT